MGELAAVVFDDQPAAADFQAQLEALAERGVIHLEGATVLRRHLDDRLTIQHEGPSELDTFWGLLVGLVLWPHWLGMAPQRTTGATATLDSWGLAPGWADAVAENMAPGNVAVMFLADRLRDPVLRAVRTTRGDLFRLRLTTRMKASLTEAFGGRPARTE